MNNPNQPPKPPPVPPPIDDGKRVDRQREKQQLKVLLGIGVVAILAGSTCLFYGFTYDSAAAVGWGFVLLSSGIPAYAVGRFGGWWKYG